MNLIQGDCIEVLPTLDADSIDAIVTDPPYGIGFMGKEWDGIPPGDEFAPEALRVLKPGAHLLAFGGTRTYHRLVVALEDAGFEIRDCIAWMYGTGFPKSRNIGNGWGTALKPAFEPIVVARKPLSERTVAANVLEHGTGALNIDATRIEGPPSGLKPYTRNVTPPMGGQGGIRAVAAAGREVTFTDHPAGRWPANVTLDEDAAAMLDEQSGESRSPDKPVTQGRRRKASGWDRPVNERHDGEGAGVGYGDTGGASRFFYVAKASRKERGQGNDHPTVKPVGLMRWLVRLVTPPGGRVLDPFMGSGTTGLAAMLEGFEFVGIERDAHYCEIARARLDALPDEPTQESLLG